MSQIILDGTLTVAPPGSGVCGFPNGAVSIPLGLSPSPKQSVVRSGPDVRQVSSPSAYVQLTGVGSSDAVTRGNTVYLKTNSPFMVRATFDNTPDADIEAEFPVSGVWVLESGDTKYLKKVEVKGSGSVEFLVSGNQ